MNRVGSWIPLLACLILSNAALAQDPRTILEEAKKRSTSMSQRYEGTLKVIDSKSKVTEKRWNFDRIGSHGDSKSVLRFSAPAEVKGVALLVVNHPDRSSDQWMWTPAVGRERRIALQDRSQRFFGTDFSFEDLEERDTDQFDYRLLGEETFEGAGCWKIESKPREKKVSQYTHSHMWVRKDNYVIVQIENFNKDKLVRRAKYGNVQRVQNIWTAHNIEMFDVERNSRTILAIEKLQYNLPMKDEDFTIQAMRRER
jgi:outer membrane lipoprotein-sorting protein